MSVFCPRCGSKNQRDTVFCRKCGEELPKLKQKQNPKDYKKKIKNLNTSNFAITAILSLFCSSFSIYLMMNKLVEGDLIPHIFLALSIILIASSMLSIYSNYYLKQTDLKFSDKNSDKFLSAETNELLPEADFTDQIPASVVENTTRKLKTEVIKNKGSIN